MYFLDHTRAIYRRKLLEVLTNEKTEGKRNCNFFSNIFFLLGEDESDLNSDDENRLYPSLSEIKSFSYDEPIIIRHDYRATTSSRDKLTQNTYG